MNNFANQISRINAENEKDIGAEFGTKLSINPNLPAHTDFSGGQVMDTPNSFKFGSGNTPTTPFGLTHLQFPQGISVTNFSTIAMQPTPRDATTEELLNFMPKTPIVPPLPGMNFHHNFSNLSTEQTYAPLNSQAQPQIKPVKPEEFPIPKPKKSSIKKGTRLKRGRTSSAGKDESRWKSWTREEEVFLVGAVMDRFFKRGSLSSTRADESNSDDSWSVIKNYYETAWKNYYMKTGIAIPTDRPANALSRHYKVMKARISQSDISGGESENFRTYFDEWESIYNVDNCLVSELNTSNGRAKALVQRQANQNFTKRKVRLSVRTASNQFL